MLAVSPSPLGEVTLISTWPVKDFPAVSIPRKLTLTFPSKDSLGTKHTSSTIFRPVRPYWVVVDTFPAYCPWAT